MNPLTRMLYTLLSQDVARNNAALAAARVMRERQQRSEVEAYLAETNRRRIRVGTGRSAVG